MLGRSSCKQTAQWSCVLAAAARLLNCASACWQLSLWAGNECVPLHDKTPATALQLAVRPAAGCLWWRKHCTRLPRLCDCPAATVLCFALVSCSAKQQALRIKRAALCCAALC
jgi:hypothetical protein